jgi:D-3-phosphoglycerate dehydrogenase
MRDQPHIIRVDNYWMNLVPSGGYFILSDHKDRPGLIGNVGMILGKADINISSMQVSRLEARGRALMVLELDEPISEVQREQLLAIPDVYSIKLVKL